ncbi:GOLPH3/VPS74 family protein [Saccharopolyspora griseoalba]|uniref:GPP34 family phosphoprotein n=1 Tax=Saccharopolyspora griseoalba TaxID=1431848 RepID=A0ABW2LJA2_9PSEU
MHRLSLPQEFVLLLHRQEGSYYACDHTGAAELAELLLTQRIQLADKKVSPLVHEPTAVAWVDDALSWLHRRGKPVAAATFIQSRTDARNQHAESLLASGLMRREDKKFLFIPYRKYHPEPHTRQLLVERIRSSVRGMAALDERMVLLCALVHATGLAPKLGLDRQERARLKEISKGNELGTAVQDVTAATVAAVTVAATAAAAAGGAAAGSS